MVTFLPFRAYNTDNQLIIDTLFVKLANMFHIAAYYLTKRNNKPLKRKYLLLNCLLQPTFHRFFFPYVLIHQFL